MSSSTWARLSRRTEISGHSHALSMHSACTQVDEGSSTWARLSRRTYAKCALASAEMGGSLRASATTAATCTCHTHAIHMRVHVCIHEGVGHHRSHLPAREPLGGRPPATALLVLLDRLLERGPDWELALGGLARLGHHRRTWDFVDHELTPGGDDQAVALVGEGGQRGRAGSNPGKRL